MIATLVQSVLAILAMCGLGQGTPKFEFYGDVSTTNSLAFAEDGTLWAGGPGGLVAFRPQSPPRTFGLEGLIAGRGIDDLWLEQGRVYASAGKTVALWNGKSFELLPGLRPRPEELVTRSQGGWQVPPRPAYPEPATSEFAPQAGNVGTHVSAVAGNSHTLYAAWYGDGIWQGDGQESRRIDAPSDARTVRAMTCRDEMLAFSSFGGAIWIRREGEWFCLPNPSGPHGSVYSLALLNGILVCGSFEDGATLYDGNTWKKAVSPTLSSNHARQQVVFQERVYLRQTTGEIDRFDGKQWTKNVFPWLLRGAATCLGVGSGKLLVGQYGGWSEFDGKRWEHHLKLPELQGFVVTALAADRNTTWVGSQERGLFRWDRRSGKLDVFDQRRGLGNDWIRNLRLDGDRILVGTFLKGAYVFGKGSFGPLTPGLEGEATGFAKDPSGGVYVGSRFGLWKLNGNGAAVVKGTENLEIQAVLETENGVWMGTPNGVAYLAWNHVAGSP